MIVLSLIGETLDDADSITGARVIDTSNPYKKQSNHRVEIWFRDWKDEGFKERLQERVEKLMKDCGIVPKDLIFSQNDYSKWQKWCVCGQTRFIPAQRHFLFHRHPAQHHYNTHFYKQPNTQITPHLRNNNTTSHNKHHAT